VAAQVQRDVRTLVGESRAGRDYVAYAANHVTLGATGLAFTGIPELDPTGAIPLALGWRRPVHLRDERRLVAVQERINLRERRDERASQLRIGRAPNHDQQWNAVAAYGCQLVGFVPDPAVMRNGHPTPLAHSLQPLLVRAVGREMLRMPLNGQIRFTQDLGKLPPKIPVGEEDAAHPARSYTTACSISAGSRS